MHRPSLAASALVLAASGFAAARPITIGASGGVTQAEVHQTQDPDQTLGLFGRIGLLSAISVQGELSRTDGKSSDVQVRGASVLAIADLATRGTWFPEILAGGGVDHEAIANSTGTIDAHHVELGLGLEYRAPSGLVIGADVRVGSRTVDQNSTITPVYCCGGVPNTGALADGQYRTARAFIGVRF